MGSQAPPHIKVGTHNKASPSLVQPQSRAETTGRSLGISGNLRAAEAPIREILTSWQVHPHRPHSHKPKTQRQPTRLSVVSQQSLTSNTWSHQVGGVFDSDVLRPPQLLASTHPQRLGTCAPGCPPTCLPLHGHPAPGRPPCPIIPTDHTPSMGTHETPASPYGAHCWKAVQGPSWGTPSTCPHGILEIHRKGTQLHQRTPEKAQPRSQASLPRAGGPRGTALMLQRAMPALGGRWPHCCRGTPSGWARLSPAFSSPQKTSFPAKTVASGTVASGTCKPTSSTTVPAARVPAPLPWPPRMRNPRRPTPTSGSAPSPSAAKAAPAPAPWRSTCVAIVVSTPFQRHVLPLRLTVPVLGLHASHGCVWVVLFTTPCCLPRAPASWEAELRGLWPVRLPHQTCVPGERPFVCLICLSAFTTKANCERHLKVHTDTLTGKQGGAGGRGQGWWGPAAQGPDPTALLQESATAAASSPPQGTSSTATW